MLKGLLEEFGRADDNNRREVLEKIGEELAERAVLLAVMNLDSANLEDQGDGKAVFKKGSKISFAMLSTQDGVTYLPVFTDWVELKKVEQYQNSQVQTLIVTFDDMAAICKGEAGIAVNPYSHNFVISPQNVVHMKQHKDAITKGYSEQVVQKETTVQIGDPADYPTEMTEAIKKHAETRFLPII